MCCSAPAFCSHDGLEKVVTMVVRRGGDHRYKLLVLDVDGTLLTSQARISPRTRAALDRAREAGVASTLATGRRLATVRPPPAGLDMPPPLVWPSGARAEASG